MPDVWSSLFSGVDHGEIPNDKDVIKYLLKTIPTLL